MVRYFTKRLEKKKQTKDFLIRMRRLYDEMRTLKEE
jgi:hypothetical protein